MRSADIRKGLHDFINKSDDKSLEALYSIVQSGIDESDYTLSPQHKALLEERLEEHEKYPNSGSSWEEVKDRVKLLVV
ncbi:addiction module protein [Roseivirga sp.]|uniref:addiction module protein n=1 Tax=Roseivirga sp. TaxID=1964215 RepID=UPI002B279025|nr:addiction module protein [Roseivirga sp.]